MKKLIFGLLVFGLTTQLYSQTIELSEVKISENYKYIDAVEVDQSAKAVKLLEDNVVSYDTKKNLPNEDCSTQEVTFEIPDGKVLAVYDDSGKILRTVEKYKNVRLPQEVLQAIAKNYPNWVIVEDVFLVNYHCNKGIKKEYKIKIQNQSKTVNLKTDESGNFL